MSGRREELDATPVEWPAGVRRPETLAEQIQRMVRVAVSQQAAAAGLETFEEADDFDIEDDEGVPFSPYELTEMQEERRFGVDASDLERPNPRSKEDERSEGVEQSRVAGSKGNVEVRPDRVQAVDGQGAVGERAGSSAEGRAGRGSGAS